jgi:hypothetical protein
MTPNVDERIGSVVRALTDVILPALPPEAGLAQEQVQLAIGHLQILRAQMDDRQAFEAEELVDSQVLGRALVDGCQGGAQTLAATAALSAAVAVEASGAAGRAARIAIQTAIADLVTAISSDGDDASRTALRTLILTHEQARATKDRHWFAPFGFDSL